MADTQSPATPPSEKPWVRWLKWLVPSGFLGLLLIAVVPVWMQRAASTTAPPASSAPAEPPAVDRPWGGGAPISVPATRQSRAPAAR